MPEKSKDVYSDTCHIIEAIGECEDDPKEETHNKNTAGKMNLTEKKSTTTVEKLRELNNGKYEKALFDIWVSIKEVIDYPIEDIN